MVKRCRRIRMHREHHYRCRKTRFTVRCEREHLKKWAMNLAKVKEDATEKEIMIGLNFLTLAASRSLAARASTLTSPRFYQSVQCRWLPRQRRAAEAFIFLRSEAILRQTTMPSHALEGEPISSTLREPFVVEADRVNQARRHAVLDDTGQAVNQEPDHAECRAARPLSYFAASCDRTVVDREHPEVVPRGRPVR